MSKNKTYKIEDKTYKEIHDFDIKRIKNVINETTPFNWKIEYLKYNDETNEEKHTYHYNEFCLLTFLEDIETYLNPRIYERFAVKEIDKMYEKLHISNGKFRTNIGNINAKYLYFINDNTTKFFNEKKECICTLKDIGNFSYTQGDENYE